MKNYAYVRAIDLIRRVKTEETHEREIDRHKAFDLAISALEKQIPKKPRKTRCALMCSTCGHKITEIGCKKLHRLYCKKCGQAIDWSDT